MTNEALTKLISEVPVETTDPQAADLPKSQREPCDVCGREGDGIALGREKPDGTIEFAWACEECANSGRDDWMNLCEYECDRPMENEFYVQDTEGDFYMVCRECAEDIVADGGTWESGDEDSDCW